MPRFIIIFLLVVFLSFVQTLNFDVFGVKPNLALVSVITATFFVSGAWEGFLLVLISALILKFSPGFSGEILTFSLIASAAVFIRKYLPWHSMINLLFLLTAATLLFYSFIFPALIVSTIFLRELIYNLIVGFIIFISLRERRGSRRWSI